MGRSPILRPRRRADHLAHLRGLLTDTEYRRAAREVRRLRAEPRFTPGATTLLGGMVLRYADWGSFLAAFDAIFERECYRLPEIPHRPRILDGGAHVGLAALYWKRRFPDARITAFEPDPANLAALGENVGSLEGVEIRAEALWTRSGELDFAAEGSDAGHVLGTEAGGREAATTGSAIRVTATRLRDWLEEPVDLLKLDVEGAEAALLLDAADRLDRVARVFVEVHDWPGRTQRLGEIFECLRHAGFRIHLAPELVSPHPFVERRIDGGMDQRLNLYADRPEPRRRVP